MASGRLNLGWSGAENQRREAISMGRVTLPVRAGGEKLRVTAEGRTMTKMSEIFLMLMGVQCTPEKH